VNFNIVVKSMSLDFITVETGWVFFLKLLKKRILRFRATSD
jgi:hypothetical protein